MYKNEKLKIKFGSYLYILLCYMEFWWEIWHFNFCEGSRHPNFWRNCWNFKTTLLASYFRVLTKFFFWLKHNKILQVGSGSVFQVRPYFLRNFAKFILQKLKFSVHPIFKNDFCKIPQNIWPNPKNWAGPYLENFIMPQPKKEFCQNSKIGSQESGFKISTILSKIRVSRPFTKIKISNFPSEFHVAQ